MNRKQTAVLLITLLGFLNFQSFARQISTAQENEINIQLADEYYEQGEIEKAQDIYRELLKNQGNIPFIHNNYYKLLTTTEQYDEAEKYMKKVLARYRGNNLYEIDLA
ncbi:MAG: hypothetical protein WBA74_14885, partial [Cyclobacteriaceae bacterium]